MTLQEAIDRVEAIKGIASDDETAHSEEDRLRHEVLEQIAAGCENASGYAAEVLKTSAIRFARWCA